ncbi:MAG: DISARM system helicase DrmA [Nostoc sp.]|uniref:DISARM system helicase DrmA n=1 Tax=Nostoc sp. TaxID=1180 RepID=UPI002FFA7E95
MRLPWSVPRSDNTYKVSIYLVNETSLIDPLSKLGKRRFETGDLIFQPQIRVVTGENAKLLPFDSFQPSDETPEIGSLQEEDESLELIYREYLAYARGHLCAAIWKEIDPERPCQGENLLKWIDGFPVQFKCGKQQWQKFSLPDCRTEYVPCYPVESPAIDWESEIEQIPDLNTATLAQAWNSTVMCTALQPLVDGYAAWIHQQQTTVSQLEPKYHRAANRHLENCRITQQRIQEAIELIIQNEEVRLAFCFANKAINLQASWRRPGHDFTWRPFQLAFILMNIPAIANPLHQDRQTCDLLAFPTGGGKTEAYLGLAAFTLGLRRLRSGKDSSKEPTGQGVSVISRYTLRLLTIQQFRRALGLIVASEVLRVENLGMGFPIGWRPKDCQRSDHHIWGTTRFSVGLWVGGSVTPNRLKDKYSNGSPLLGAISALEGKTGVEGDPAQILNCPCCGSILAIPRDGLLGGKTHIIYLVMQGAVANPSISHQTENWEELESEPIFSSSPVANSSNYITLSLSLNIKKGSKLSVGKLEGWWRDKIQPQLNSIHLAPFRISRPGYFKRIHIGTRKGSEKIENFEIYCANPDCDLNTQKIWNEKVPLGFNQKCDKQTSVTDKLVWEKPLEAFKAHTNFSSRIPISAYTVDDQVYSRIPSLLVATVDKFARLAFEPRASALFGNINHYNSRSGFYRDNAGASEPKSHNKAVNPLLPPDLILQDELHLIEGPLGSMVGLYETAADTLCERIYQGQLVNPKYIASTATVRQSQSQVQCLFNRSVFQFPPPALSADNSFFARTSRNVHPLEIDANGKHPSGRLYVAVCAPGKGAQTPIVRIYSSMFQSIEQLKQTGYSDSDCDPFWTLVGYFNAIRELAGAVTLYRQDIPERLRHNADIMEVTGRELEEAIELSSRMDSTELPGLLSSLSLPLPDARDAVLSTSMFGTGVDIDRLGLMVVNGQPKTTSSYIQATGRVGRSTGGLVITFFRASRPRDLDHYEFFTGYHRAIYRYVEPITVTPFASRARERGIGPVAVALLRQARTIQGVNVLSQWAADARHIGNARNSAELGCITEVIKRRSQIQLETRRPPEDQVNGEMQRGLDRWETIAQQENNLEYVEYAINKPPTKPVVLGDEQHQQQDFKFVFRNSPQSLREVESMTRFGYISINQQNQANQGS